jgi:hypothetical protein
MYFQSSTLGLIIYFKNVLGFPWVSRYLVLNCVDTKYLPKFHLGLQKRLCFLKQKILSIA